MGKLDLDRLLNELGVKSRREGNTAASPQTPGDSAGHASVNTQEQDSELPPMLRQSEPSSEPMSRKPMVRPREESPDADSSPMDDLSDDRLYGPETTTPTSRPVPPADDDNGIFVSLDSDLHDSVPNSELALYQDDEIEISDGDARLSRLLVERHIVAASQLTTARSVMKKSPGVTLVDVLLQQGAEEVDLLDPVIPHGRPAQPGAPSTRGRR